MKTRPMLRWPGGKSRLAKKIIAQIPDHVCYVEPFAGGLGVLFAKERSEVEVVNDTNGDLVALLLNVQRHYPEMVRQVQTLFSSRQLFHLFGAQPGLTEIERAARFLFRNRISFGGNMHSFGVSKTRGGGAGFGHEFVANLMELANKRLDKVVIENISYERCFENYDSKDTFFFIDPPYLHAKIHAYDGWNEKQMETFHRHVRRLKGQWLITLDDSEFNRTLFSGYKIESVQSFNQSVNKRTHGDRKFSELIITPQ